MSGVDAPWRLSYHHMSYYPRWLFRDDPPLWYPSPHLTHPGHLPLLTFPTAPFGVHRFAAAVFDEAHKLKGINSATRAAVQELNIEWKLLLTGKGGRRD